MNYGVYVIAPVQGWPCKVGVAQSPIARLVSLQTGSWEELHYHEGYRLQNKSDAFKLESLCKRRLKERRLKGEWFNVFVDDMIDCLEMIVKECTMPLMRVTETIEESGKIVPRSICYNG